MPIRSAGLLLYRFSGHELQILLAHPGGPFWAKRDLGAWSIPKGEILPGEEPRHAALREFAEEIGTTVEDVGLIELGEARQPSRKVVIVFAAERDMDPAFIRSNLVELEWPPRTGRKAMFPEIDRAAWFPIAEARRHVLPGQAVFLDRLEARLAVVR